MTNEQTLSARFNRPGRLFWTFSSILLGIIPSLLFMTWIQGNMTLPGELHRALTEKLSWPWLALQERSESVRIGADAVLLIGAGMLTFLAGKVILYFPPQIRRSAELTILGITLFSVMSSWQYTGLVFWGIRLQPGLSQTVSFILYYGFVAAGFIFSAAIRDPFHVLGLRQLDLDSKKNPRADFFSRESLILFGLAALLTPLMSVDRFLVVSFIAALIALSRITNS